MLSNPFSPSESSQSSLQYASSNVSHEQISSLSVDAVPAEQQSLHLRVPSSHVIWRLEQLTLELLQSPTSDCPNSWHKLLSSKSAAAERQLAVVVRAMQFIITSLRNGQTSTQRDLYYHLGGLADHRQGCVNQAISTLASMIHVPRSALGIHASTRGLIGGCITLGNVDLTREPFGTSVPGAFGELAEYIMESDQTNSTPKFPIRIDAHAAQYLIIVEKDAVFQRLMEDRIFDRMPSILVTGRGYPDLATRALVRAIAMLFPDIIVVGIADCNPSGVRVLWQYKHGPRIESHLGETKEIEHRVKIAGVKRSRTESLLTHLPSPIAVPELRWIGLFASDLAQCMSKAEDWEVDSAHIYPLSARDKSAAGGIINDLNAAAAAQMTENDRRKKQLVCHPWTSRLQEMLALGLKCDIEALSAAAKATTVTAFLERKLLRREWI